MSGPRRLSLLVALLSPAACGRYDGARPGAARECTGGTQRCGLDCVQLDSDPQNCGGCGHACQPSEVCAAGTCATSCPPGITRCESSCFDTQNDPAHCGGCETACSAGLVCSQGQCGTTCAGGTTQCDGRCVDLQADLQNCGSINIAKGTSLFSVCESQSANPGCWDSDVSSSSCSLGTALLAGTGFEKPSFDPCLIGGGTYWLTTAGNVVPGQILEIRIAIWDVGDNIFDSLVVMDGFKWMPEATLPGTG